MGIKLYPTTPNFGGLSIGGKDIPCEDGGYMVPEHLVAEIAQSFAMTDDPEKAVKVNVEAPQPPTAPAPEQDAKAVDSAAGSVTPAKPEKQSKQK